jgi:hypothetical protein
MVFLADVEYGQAIERFCTEQPGMLVDTMLAQPKYTEPGDIVITLEQLREAPGQRPRTGMR